MTTFIYTTSSDEVEVTDESAVEELVSEYYFTVEPTIENGRISFQAHEKPNAAFDVYETPDQRESVVEEFLSLLAEYLTSGFEVRCIEVEGEGQPDAWKWVIGEDGDVTEIRL
jgi:hypothetical protein